MRLGFAVSVLQGAHSTHHHQDTTTTTTTTTGPPAKSATANGRDVEQELRRKGAHVIPWEDAIATWGERRMVSSYPIFSELQ